ncbi:hypothetical protein OKW22_000390 [Bacilli bacterium PM5-3]|nr:hypothetical protein [Bacilli bacterium PM5-3]
MRRMKRLAFSLISIIFISFCVACSNQNTKTVKIEKFNYNKIKETEFVKKTTELEKIDNKYNVYNKNFEYINDKGSCSVFNKVDDSNFYINYDDITNLKIYRLINNECKKITSFKNVGALSIDIIAYKDNLYLNIIFNDDTNNKSGLWMINKFDNKKHLSSFFSMASDLDIDKVNDKLYSLEQLEDTSFFRKYSLNGEKEAEYEVKGERAYMKFYIDNNKVNFIDINEIKEYTEYEYIIDTYMLDSVFKDIKNPSKKRVIIKGSEYFFNNIEKTEKYIIFNGLYTQLCKIDFSKCVEYDRALFLNYDNYFLISKDDSRLDPIVYIHDFGSYDVDKLLTNDDVYQFRVVENDLFMKIYEQDYNEYKTIKYKLK